MNKNDTALIFCLDENKKNKYEWECVHCVNCWRRVKHSLSDIDILIYVNRKSRISQRTIDAMKKHKNVFFKYYDMDDAYEKYLCLNTLYCQSMFEKFERDYKYRIYSDLDLYLKREIPVELLNSDKTVFFTYDETNYSDGPYNYRFANALKLKTRAFNTCLVINNRKNGLFFKLLDVAKTEDYLFYFKNFVLYENDFFYFEEGVYDYAYFKRILNNGNCVFASANSVISFRNPVFLHKHIKTFDDYCDLEIQTK